MSGAAGDPAIVRGLCLFVPLFAAVAAGVAWPPSRRTVAAAILATAWNLAFLPGLNLFAGRVGWWGFDAEGGTAAGLPVDLLLGWALLWGTLPALAARRLPPALTGTVLVWLDLALMPMLAPVVRLGDGWLYGELAAAASCLVPGLLLARWTDRGERLAGRALGQIVLTGALMLALPVAALGPVPPTGTVLGFAVQLLGVPVLLGVAAVREFAVRGGGTPLPYDPPHRLVTSGPYAYVRNPMQLSLALSYLLLAAFTGDPRLLVGVVVSFAYGAGLAAWHEGGRLNDRYGAAWAAYTAGVRPWLPRWKPWPGTAPARIYVARTCGVCDDAGRWILRRSPTALEVAPAEDHPAGLRRITYESYDGRERAEGVAAIGRMLQHLHLGWALLGWILLVPGVTPLAQLIVDALGGAPRELSGPAAPVSPVAPVSPRSPR